MHRRLLVFLLLTLWLPAHAHCRLEAAGLIPADACCAAEPGVAAEDSCADGLCFAAEDEFPASAELKVAAPAPAASACLAHRRDLNPGLAPRRPAPAGLSNLSAAPPEVGRAWVFAERAALPVRAP